ncbi:phosphatase PAP2 family protein [Streptomyces sp. HPF1205]|uniref:phosphatase PAP2 family protein n=1 Tax=Streptomyces sp. HPF1205 TaxID=2873262 RepID=UPI001CEC1C2F|nr:phosphatase PAP2 family protein [Streptomyces sp. HPF1205]
MWEADRRLLDAFRACGDAPGVAAVARELGRAGEHAGVWLAAGMGGACLDAGRRDAWLRASALVAGAHVASMVLKRFFRRPRPCLPRPGARPSAPLVRTAGRHSFPSSHAASSAAAAVAFTALAPRVPFRPLAVGVCLSRLVAGVHYPSDVAFGVLLGAAAARLGRPWALPERIAEAGGGHG